MMMSLPRMLLLATLPLLVSCQAVTRSQVAKDLGTLTYPMTRAEFAEHVPAVSPNPDPPVFSFLFTPNDFEYCRLKHDLYLILEMDYRHATSSRCYPDVPNPVRRGRGNRTGSIAISPDLPTHTFIQKARPDARDVILSARFKSREDESMDEYLLEAYQEYKDAESRALTSGS